MNPPLPCASVLSRLPVFLSFLLLLSGNSVAAQRTLTDSTSLWQSYVADPEDHPHIPNNSYAGYHRGEKPVPDVPVVTSVVDHGALGDGITDDSAAFRDAINAAYHAGGGAVLVPAGTYAIADTVWLHRSGVVLRGAGEGQSILRFTRPLLDSVGEESHGTNIWSWSGGLVWIGPRDDVAFVAGDDAWHQLDRRGAGQGYESASNTWEYWRQGPLLATVTENHPRGTRTLTVDDASSLRPGQFVLMTWDNPADESLWEAIGQHSLFSDPVADWDGFGSWFSTESYPRWQWTAEIASVDGNEITLRQPIRVATRPEWNVRLWNHGEHDRAYVEEVGLEDLTIELDGGIDGPADEGWNGVYLNRAYNCWVRNVEVLNGTNGFHVSASKNCSLLHTAVRGDRWAHHPYSNRCMSHDIFYENFTIDISEDAKGGTHGLNTEWRSTGNVWSKGTMNRGTLDTHLAMSFDMIRTEITLRNEENSNPGGAKNKAGAYSGRRMVHWNLTVSGSDRAPSERGLYVYQPDVHTFGAMVGIQGAALCEIPGWNNPGLVMPHGDKDVLIADEGMVPDPLNLYDAQLADRAARESWIHFTSPFREVVPPEESVSLAVAANAAGGDIAEVCFYVDGSLVETDTTAPYAVDWTPPARGRYSLTATMETAGGETVSTVPARDLTVGTRVFLNHNHPSLSYEGSGWESISDPVYLKGGAAKTTDGGSYMQITFRGTRAEFISTADLGEKIAFSVYIDDMQTPVFSDNIRGQGGFRDSSWRSPLLEDRAHTLRIASDRSLIVDAILIDSTSDSLDLAPPEAIVTATPPNGLPPLTVNLDASASYDPDGQILEYRWDFGDGSDIAITSVPTTSHTYTAMGEYTVTLTVIDNDGAQGQGVAEVFVGNLLPAAAFSVDTDTGNPPLDVQFDGSGSTDPDGTIVLWEWDFTSDGTVDATGPTAGHAYTAAGVHVARLTVTDDLGGTDTTTRQITVNGLFAPSVLTQPSDLSVYAGFDAVFSAEVAGNPEPTVQWYKNGSPIPGETSATLELVDVQLSDDGTTYSLVATNSEGSVQTEAVTLSVTEAPPGTSVKLVDWGGDYVDSSRIWPRLEGGERGEGADGEFGDDGLTDDVRKRLPFSDSEPMNPAVGPSCDGRNAVFYGGGVVWRLDEAGSKVLWRGAHVEENGKDDYLFFNMSNGSDRRNFVLFYWKQEDFLDLTTGDISFNETSRLTANVTGSSGGMPRIHFVVRNAGQFYISEAYQDGQGLFELTSETLRDTLWAAYDPANNLQPVPGDTGVQTEALVYDVSTFELDRIDAAGVLAIRYAHPGGGNNIFHLADFEVFAAPASASGFNQAPSVSLTSPADGSVFAEPASFSLSAEASDVDGSVAEVTFYRDGSAIGAVTNPPYVWEQNLEAGSYEFLAIATDDDGSTGTSATASVTVEVPAMTLLASSLLGGAGNDQVNGVRVLSDGTLALAGGFTDPFLGGRIPVLLDGATESSPGAIVRLGPEGRHVLSVTRLPGAVTDLAVDALDRLYAAVPGHGLYRLNEDATTVLLKRLSGEQVQRADATGDGTFAGLVMADLSNPDSTSGSVQIHLFDNAGTEQASMGSVTQNTLDLALDPASETVCAVGWRQTSASAEDNGNVLPVQIAAMRGWDYAGNVKWTNYNWESGPWDPANPNHLNQLTNNMADTRGLRCSMGADGKLYAAFEAAGGNHIFRWEPDDLSTAVDIVGGDMWHEFYATASEHKLFFARYEPDTGAYLLGQQVTTRYWDGSQDKGNTFRIKGGEIAADAEGRVYVVGASASGMPMPPTHGYTGHPDRIAFNPLPDPVYTGGAYFLHMDADFAVRRFVTRLCGGNSRAVDARIPDGETHPTVVWGGRSADINVNWNGIGDTVGGQLPSQPEHLFHAHHPVQRAFGGGDGDGFFGVVAVRDASMPQITMEPADLTAAVGTTATFVVGADGNPPVAYRWMRDGSPIANAVGAAHSFTVQAGDDGATFSCEVANADGSVTSSVATLNVGTPLPTFAEWISGHHGGSSDPAMVGPEANPDGDQLVNIVEYLLGLDPTQTDGSGALSLTTTPGDRIVLEFVLEREVSGIVWAATYSTDLTQWYDDANVTVEEVEDLGDRRRMRAWASMEDNTQRFLRLEVREAP